MDISLPDQSRGVKTALHVGNVFSWKQDRNEYWDPVSRGIDKRLRESLRLAGTSGHHLVQPHCSKQAQSQLVAQGHAHSNFYYFPGWRLLNLSWQPALIFDQPHSKKGFSYICMEFLVFQFVPIASCWVVFFVGGGWLVGGFLFCVCLLLFSPIGHHCRGWFHLLHWLPLDIYIPALLASPHMTYVPDYKSTF